MHACQLTDCLNKSSSTLNTSAYYKNYESTGGKQNQIGHERNLFTSLNFVDYSLNTN